MKKIMSYSISMYKFCKIAQLSVKHMQNREVYFFYLSLISSYSQSLYYTQLKDEIEKI